jgi:predicted nucleotide-binding protein
MSNISDELFEIAEELDSIRAEFDSAKVKASLDKLEDAASRVGKSWSGSWLGYHSRVYYKDFQSPPPGARFSQEWGFIQADWFNSTSGEWAEHTDDDVRHAIYDLAGNPDLKPVEEVAEKVRNIIEDKLAEVLSLITTALDERDDPFLTKLKRDSEGAVIPNVRDFVNHYRPSGQFVSRDMAAIGQGFLPPPHIVVLAEVFANRAPAKACEVLSKTAKQAGSHLAKRERYSRKTQEMGTNVFIGHGRSLMWKDLKDFVQDRISLPWDEFNRVPVAGITNIARLSQMLDDAAIAFLILTAEDEQADGKLQARMNVIHEAGLFQGKLGFSRAIILLEEGCEEFSNIQGLGQIRFPKGNIRVVFEDIRQVLEREGLV